MSRLNELNQRGGLPYLPLSRGLTHWPIETPLVIISFVSQVTHLLTQVFVMPHCEQHIMDNHIVKVI